jgi:hypothetical protein
MDEKEIKRIREERGIWMVFIHRSNPLVEMMPEGKAIKRA